MSRASLSLSLAFLAGLLLPLTACSRQLEGERCALTNGNADCDGTLVCTNFSTLRGGDDKVDRCCPDRGDPYTDSRCAPKTGGTTQEDLELEQAGRGGAGGMSSTELENSLGDACNYNSDCAAPLVCGGGGKCQNECIEDRDCDDGMKCNDEKLCVAN